MLPSQLADVLGVSFAPWQVAFLDYLDSLSPGGIIMSYQPTVRTVE